MDSDFVYDELIDLEDRSRRNNLRVYGISNSKYETWEKCEEKVDEVFREKLGLENIHSVKRRKKDKSIKTRTIVCKLVSFKEKKTVYEKCKEIEKYENFHG